MPDTVGSLAGGRVRGPLLLLFTLALARAAAAQQPVVAAPPAESEFLPRYDFHLNASALATSDPRFRWDAHFGGTLDLVDYVGGRLSFTGDYETLLGNELRPFDPNQSLYTLEGAASARAGSVELQAMFHHVSRHLSDRANRVAVAWNELGVRALHRADAGGTKIDLDLEAGRVVARAFVDYTWMGEVNVRATRPLSPRVEGYVHGMGRLFATDDSVPDRVGTSGGSAEIGVRLLGRAAVMELFAGVEKRPDAYPLERTPLHWAMAGFRLLSR